MLSVATTSGGGAGEGITVQIVTCSGFTTIALNIAEIQDLLKIMILHYQ
jgi:hypothetical protein